MNENDDEWTDRERALLAGLDATEEPPPELEARVVSALKERGLLWRAPRVPWRSLAAAAAALAIGFGLGRTSAGAGRTSAGAGRTQPVQVAGSTASGAPARPARTFMLLLYPGAGLDPAPAAEQQRVEEYRRWARGLAVDGRMVSGEKLRDGVTVFAGDATDASASALQGFFLIRAATAEEAEGIARACPHRAHGGTVALREVDPT
jgi:hypothetical protein